MEGTVNKAAGLVFLLCRCGDRDFHVYLSLMQRNRLRHKILSISQKGMNTQVQKIEFIVLKIKPLRGGS